MNFSVGNSVKLQVEIRLTDCKKHRKCPLIQPLCCSGIKITVKLPVISFGVHLQKKYN